jgi:hypothetical protein
MQQYSAVADMTSGKWPMLNVYANKSLKLKNTYSHAFFQMACSFMGVSCSKKTSTLLFSASRNYKNMPLRMGPWFAPFASAHRPCPLPSPVTSRLVREMPPPARQGRPGQRAPVLR